ncbi:hypothetical protein CDAR_250591 [Caerostris darwini]|uniref:Uncharacterized protein n=1 Tax=Caerostris darwini TaxID=1538125 RepID=A0AAV4RQH8_9ARAC|nr:hypothetical protein CDAR_250591 [Caerostris darwini]
MDVGRVGNQTEDIKLVRGPDYSSRGFSYQFFCENAPFSIFGLGDEKRVWRSIILLVLPVASVPSLKYGISLRHVVNQIYPYKYASMSIPEEFLAILYPPVPLEKWKLIVIAGDIDSVDIPGDKDSGAK